MSASSALLDLLGIDLPIVQAPMARVSTPAMAAAVANAGGLGSIGVGADNAATARRMIAEVRERTSRSLNVNVFCHQPARVDRPREAAWLERLRPEFEKVGGTPPTKLTEIYESFLEDDDMVTALVEARPKVVSFHFGVPSPRVMRVLREAGVVLLGSATCLLEARTLAEAGVHAVVAQGYEAGGHRSIFEADASDERLGTVALVSLLAGHLRIPIIAAGGIMNGAGISEALAAGASAAQLGTAFIPCPESLADDAYRAALMSDAAKHTEMTSVITGRPARCLANRFTAWGKDVTASAIPEYPIAYDAAKALHEAGKAQREFGYGPQWAGTGAPLARAMGAGELVGVLAAEMRG